MVQKCLALSSLRVKGRRTCGGSGVTDTVMRSSVEMMLRFATWFDLQEQSVAANVVSRLQNWLWCCNLIVERHERSRVARAGSTTGSFNTARSNTNWSEEKTFSEDVSRT
eukprot:3937429-Rhodomonas_salina.4